MKNSKMLLVLATSMATVAMSADNNPHVLPFGEHIAVEVSSNDTSDDGNILHKIISHQDDEDFEVDFHFCIKPGAIKKNLKIAIQHPQYEGLFKDVASALYFEEKRDMIKEDVLVAVKEKLKILLSSKNTDGRTPLELVKELKKSGNDFVYDYMEMALEGVVLEPENPEEKQMRLELKAKDRQDALAEARNVQNQINEALLFLMFLGKMNQ